MRILLGVTGSIAAYKACELLRLLQKDGHEVRVLMSRSAESFVGPLTFESLSGFPVLRSLEESIGLSATSHIDLANWGEVLVVAPATANFIAKFRQGIADDALLTESLAFQGQIIVAPAMNTRMWMAAVTQENIIALKKRHVLVLDPNSGLLACGEEGLGKMPAPLEILKVLQNLFPQPLRGKKVLVTSGPTRAYLDPVRFITNKSSGRMGHALAKAAEALGASVTLVTGPVAAQFQKLCRGKVVPVETTEEMLSACLLENPDIIIGAAAVCDFQSLEAGGPLASGKWTREEKTITLKPSIDVIATLSAQFPQAYVVGFSAETSAKPERAYKKLSQKSLDLIVFNDISRSDSGMESENNEVILISEGRETPLPHAPKEHIAKQILSHIVELHVSKGTIHENPAHA